MTRPVHRFEVPAVATSARVVRQAAAAIAAAAGADMDEVDDLQSVSNEVVSVLLGDDFDADATVTISVVVDDAGMDVTGSRSDISAGWTLDPVASEVLAALSDRHDATVDDGRVTVSVALTRSHPAAT